MTVVCLAMPLQSYLIWDDDDDGDNDGVPQPTLYDCQSYFKRIKNFALAQNN